MWLGPNRHEHEKDNRSDARERFVEGTNQSDGLADLPAPERGEAPRTASPDLEQSSSVLSSPSRSLLSRLRNLVGGTEPF